MRLVDWAKKEGISYRTAWRWFHAGKLPVPAIQTETGMILVKDEDVVPSTEEGKVTIYSRVSSHDQKEDLERQTGRLKAFASARGWIVINVVEEIGFGLNGHRRKLLRILSDPTIGIILVEHKDRLTRFGFEFIEAALVSQGRSIIAQCVLVSMGKGGQGTGRGER